MNSAAKVLDHLNVLVVELSPTGHIQFANRFWNTKLGYVTEDLCNKEFLDFVHPEDSYSTELSLKNLLITGEPIKKLRNRFVTPGNGEILLEWSAEKSPDGNAIASAIPIEDKSESEDDVTRKAKLFNQAQTLARIGYWTMDTIDQEVTWSDEIYDIFGVSRDTYQPTVETALSFYHPDDIPMIQRCIEDATERGLGWDFEARIKTPQNETRNIRCKADIIFNDQGVPEQIFGIFHDKTEEIATYERARLFSKAVETTITGVVITNALYEVTWVNKAFTNISGYDLKEIKGKTLGPTLQGSGTSQKSINEIRQKLLAGQKVDTEILNYHKNGTPYWTHLLIAPIYEGKEITHFVGLYSDITQRKEKEELRINTNKVMMVGELSAGICHDLNNILSIISGNADLLQGYVEGQKGMPYWEKLNYGITRAKDVTSKLLKTVRPNENEERLIIVNEILRENIQFFTETLPTNITVESELDSNGMALIVPDAFSDLVLNLLINAQKSITGTGRILIRTRTEKDYIERADYSFSKPGKSDSYFKLEVIDDGCGINKSDLAKIFHPFYTSREDTSGTGLGLSSVTSFVVESNAGLSVSSVVGKGSTFKIWLPESKGSVENSLLIKSVDKKALDDKRIVLVDDEEDVLDIQSQMLGIAGASVVTFQNPAVALEYIAEHDQEVDGVITDQTMNSEIQGHILIDKIKKSWPHIPCALLTGFSAHEDVQNCDALIIQKPIRFASLVDSISEMIK